MLGPHPSACSTAIALLAVASPAQAATPKERSLARQVKALKAQTAKLTRERNTAGVQLAAAQTRVTTLTSERDMARSTLATAQLGTARAVSTMTPQQITSTLFPTIYQVFEGWKDGYDDGDLSASGSSSHSVDGDGDNSWYYSFSLNQW